MSVTPSNGARAYECARASSAHADGLLALFESASSGCFCNYWYFEGDKNAWLERCYLTPEQNRAALVARLARPELCGVVAVSRPDQAVLGWLNVSRAAGVPRLYDQRIYRNLPCFQGGSSGENGANGANGDREGVFAVACCYVAEAERGRGVAKALLGAAITAVREAGGNALEAFPRRAPDGEKLRPDEIWLGPEAMFGEAGFAIVSDFRPYPVLRLHLR